MFDPFPASRRKQIQAITDGQQIENNPAMTMNDTSTFGCLLPSRRQKQRHLIPCVQRRNRRAVVRESVRDLQI
jgi:hypothetical protein